MKLEAVMRVRFLQAGGVAGFASGCDLDTDTLPLAEARELESLVDASGLPISGVFRSPRARDLRSYEIHVENGAARLDVTFDDLTLPVPARPLIGFLRRHARPRAAGGG